MMEIVLRAAASALIVGGLICMGAAAFYLVAWS